MKILQYDGQCSRIPKFRVSKNVTRTAFAYPKRGGDPQKRPGPRLGRTSRCWDGVHPAADLAVSTSFGAKPHGDLKQMLGIHHPKNMQQSIVCSLSNIREINLIASRLI